MGYTVELEADDLWCKSEADAVAAAKLVVEDEWIHPYHLQVTAAQCDSGDMQGHWFLGIDEFNGDHWQDSEARCVWFAIAPHMADGATIEFQGEGRERWRIRWQDGRVFEEYVTEVSIDDLPLEAGLKPGMTAEVRILAQQHKNVLMVPVQAICERDSQHYAFHMTGSTAAKRTVTVGDNNEKFIIVAAGLEEGDKVALNARRRLAAEIKASTQNGKLDTSPVKATTPAPAVSPGVKVAAPPR